jgi:hypothetical protein
MDGYNPDEHTVDEVNAYLADADDTERQRVLSVEADGQNRKGIMEGPHAPTDGSDEPDAGSTKGQTFAEAAEAATPAEVGYLGTSPEAERTGRTDKGLSQRNPAILRGGPVPDARPGVDDTKALKG